MARHTRRLVPVPGGALGVLRTRLGKRRAPRGSQRERDRPRGVAAPLDDPHDEKELETLDKGTLVGPQGKRWGGGVFVISTFAFDVCERAFGHVGEPLNLLRDTTLAH